MEKIKHPASPETANVKFFITISDFFTFSTLPQHLKLLDHWHQLISGDQFYNRSNSPADLLYKYRHFIELYEAAFEAYLIPGNCLGNLAGTRSAQEQLIAEESERLDHYPSHLDIIAVIEPFNVIKKIFSKYDINYYKEQLFEWLVDGLSGIQPQDNTLFTGPLYNYTVQLVEACWLINARENALQVNEQNTDKIVLISDEWF